MFYLRIICCNFCQDANLTDEDIHEDTYTIKASDNLTQSPNISEYHLSNESIPLYIQSTGFNNNLLVDRELLIEQSLICNSLSMKQREIDNSLYYLEDNVFQCNEFLVNNSHILKSSKSSVPGVGIEMYNTINKKWCNTNESLNNDNQQINMYISEKIKKEGVLFKIRQKMQVNPSNTSVLNHIKTRYSIKYNAKFQKSLEPPYKQFGDHVKIQDILKHLREKWSQQEV